MKKEISEHILISIALVILIVFFSLSCGCVEVGADEEPAIPPIEGSTIEPQGYPASSPPPIHQMNPGLEENPGVSAVQEHQLGTATYADPIPPAIAGNLTYRDLNLTPEPFPRPFDYPTAPFFQESYALKWNNIALVAKPDSPPFVIEFKVEAGTKNPYDAQVLLTVRENSTGRVVAEDGYNGKYSSEEVKRITIRDAGEYHINLYGYKATVHLVLRGGVPEDQAVPYWSYTNEDIYYQEDEHREEEEIWFF